MARAGSINYQVSNIIKSVNGIGKSKLESRNESGLKAESGHKVSDLVHSYKSLDNIRGELTNLAKFAKEHHQQKDMSQINSTIIKDWIQSKKVSYSTASNYLSNINKVSDFLNIQRSEVKELRAEFRTELPKQELGTRSYKNLDKIQLHERSQPAFELQRDYGLRVSASTHINIYRQLNGNTLEYQEKGGKWNEKELTRTLAIKIRNNAVDGKYIINNRTYSRDLQKEIEATGQKYSGTHGIRHSYAQNRIKQGDTKQEVSEAMGHSRSEIVNTYLR